MYKMLGKSQSLGLRMNPDNRCVQLADRVTWDNIFEETICRPVSQRDRKRGKTPAPCARFSDHPEQVPVFGPGTCGAAGRKPLFTVFYRPSGLPGPFDASTLVWFRKWIPIDILNEANEYMLEHKDDDGPMPPASDGTDGGCPTGGSGHKQRYTHH